MSIPFRDLACLVLAAVVAGVATGVLAGVFGVGGTTAATSSTSRSTAAPAPVRMRVKKCGRNSNAPRRSSDGASISSPNGRGRSAGSHSTMN
jgi:hypothetical protein